jgi:hypothetical protein
MSTAAGAMRPRCCSPEAVGRCRRSPPCMAS